uniref:Uncharacterized protein n=1 Tax=Daphnia galeata TaxID=27404 RepID=A0A8J2W2T6_9CRUS|nr:unnamed protein product [Daphnia galeata]
MKQVITGKSVQGHALSSDILVKVSLLTSPVVRKEHLAQALRQICSRKGFKVLRTPQPLSSGSCRFNKPSMATDSSSPDKKQLFLAMLVAKVCHDSCYIRQYDFNNNIHQLLDPSAKKINQLRWSNNRLTADCDELKRFKQYMETVFVAKDKHICSLNEIVTAKKLEEAQNQKRPDEAQAARTEDLYFPDPEDILQHRDDEDEENELRDLEERFSNQQLKDHEEIDELINQELRDHQDDFEELTNQELRDHQEYMEELTNHEFKDMYEFGEDFCDSMF